MLIVFTERGVYRTGETVHVTALLRDAVERRRPRRAADHGGHPLRRRGISPQRRAGPGHRRPLARRADHLLGADRDLARRSLHRPEAARRSARRPSWSRTMCRIGSNSISPPRPPASRPTSPAKIDASTGASCTARPPRASTLDGEINIAKVTELPGFAGYVFGLDDDSDAEQDEEFDTIPLADLPRDRQRRQSELHRDARQGAGVDAGR